MRKQFNLIMVVAFLLLPLMDKAQNYKSAVGLRGGVCSGISLQFNRDEVNAIEGMLTFGNRAVQLTVLREYYKPVLLRYSAHIYAYYGFGGHLGFEWNNSYSGYREHAHLLFAAGPAAGIDGIAGAEYRFFKVPISLGINFKPFAEFSVTRIFRLNVWDFGCSLKYSFK